eukprot:COSAG02_NODE_785_length_17228_cov_24.082141_17_plen_75_part_00
MDMQPTGGAHGGQSEQGGSGFNPQAGPEPLKYQYWYAKKTSGPGRSVESAAFTSEFYVLQRRCVRCAIIACTTH